MQTATVLLEWTFTPPNYFEELIEVHRNDYVMTIADGKAEARIDAKVFDRDPSIRQTLHDSLNDRFLGAQLVVRVDAEGRSNIFLEVSPAIAFAMGCAVGIQIKDRNGNIVADTRKDRIEKKKSQHVLSLCFAG